MTRLQRLALQRRGPESSPIHRGATSSHRGNRADRPTFDAAQPKAAGQHGRGTVSSQGSHLFLSSPKWVARRERHSRQGLGRDLPGFNAGRIPFLRGFSQNFGSRKRTKGIGIVDFFGISSRPDPPRPRVTGNPPMSFVQCQRLSLAAAGLSPI